MPEPITLSEREWVKEFYLTMHPNIRRMFEGYEAALIRAEKQRNEYRTLAERNKDLLEMALTRPPWIIEALKFLESIAQGEAIPHPAKMRDEARELLGKRG